MELSQDEIKELQNLINKYKNPEENLENRFWTSTLKGDLDECWNWIGKKNSQGYGILSICGKGKRAHRISWELRYNQKVPENMLVLHHCDNPSCVNPNHLYCGTGADNTEDMFIRNRNPNTNDRLSARDTFIIRGFRECRRHWGDIAEIAKNFNTSPGTVTNILNADRYFCKEGYFIYFVD